MKIELKQYWLNQLRNELTRLEELKKISIEEFKIILKRYDT